MILRSDGAPYSPQTSADWDDRFSKALLISAIAHIALIFGLHFKAANPALFENTTPPLDVVLVNAKSLEAPLNAELLAQHNLAGGGTVEENRQASTPLPASQHDQEQSANAEINARMQALEAKTQAMMRQLKSDYKTPPPTPTPLAEARPDTPLPAPTDLTQRSIEMARLHGKIEQEYSEYQKRPRRIEIGANAREHNQAMYLEAWRTKIERIGNLNYPEIARRNHIYGSLVLTVCIKENGELEQVAVSRPSGNKILDASAQHIVNLAAPFGRFPPALRKDADILCISRTWTFTRSDELATSQ